MAASVKVAKGMATTNRLDALRLRLVAGETAKRMGALIRAARLAKGIRTQRELADLIDNDAVNNQRVSDWERGVHQPSERHLTQLAAALDVDIAYFYGAGKQPATPPLLEVLNGEDSQLDRIEKMLESVTPAATKALRDDPRDARELAAMHAKLDDLQEAVDRIEGYLREQASAAVRERVSRAARQQRKRRDTRRADPAAEDG